MELLKTFALLQNRRAPWLLMAFAALILNLLAHYVFQLHRGLAACELCVYIRFAMFAVVFGAGLCAIKPDNIILRLLFGYLLTGYGIIQGLIWNIRLERIHITLDKLKDGGDFFALGAASQLCSSEPHYPLGLAFHKWFPSWFNPEGGCGEVNWSLLGFNMPECLFVFYAIYTLAFILMILSFIKFGIPKKG